MMSPCNIEVDFERNPHSIAYVTEDESVTYEEMRQQADYLASFVAKRSLVFFIATNSAESLVAYEGFIRNKIILCMISPSIDFDSFNVLLEDYHPEYVWCPDNFSYRGIKVAAHGSYCLFETGYDNEPAPHPDLALLLTTSGSTGSRKYVRLSHGNIEENARSISEYLAIKKTDRAITTLPFSYSYGISIINSHLLLGASIILTDKTLMDRGFWNLLKEEEATTFGGVPYTYAMLRRLRFERMDTPSLRYITQAGGALGEELHRDFARICAEKEIDFFVMYGQTEATARLSYLPPERTAEKIGSIGIPIPGGKFFLYDDSGLLITKPDTPGELIYRGKNVSMGYAVCRNDLSKGDERKGCLETGDIACFDSDGYYRIIGRKKRFLKVYGNRVNLDEVEQILCSHGYSAACSGKDDAVDVYVEQADAAEVQRLLTDKTSLNKEAFRVMLIESIPRNDAGKIMYTALEDLC